MEIVTHHRSIAQLKLLNQPKPHHLNQISSSLNSIDDLIKQISSFLKQVEDWQVLEVDTGRVEVINLQVLGGPWQPLHLYL